MILYGGAGDDLIYGGSGNDLIAGGGGNNTIHAGQGNNIVFGNAGLNIDLGTPMDMRSSPDLRSLYALTLVLSPDQAAGQAVGAAADRLAVGGNTITAGDGSNIVFANFGRIVTVTPVNYLRDRGDFIDPAAPERRGPLPGGRRPARAGNHQCADGGPQCHLGRQRAQRAVRRHGRRQHPRPAAAST